MSAENPQRTEPTFNQRGFVEVPGWMKIHRLDEYSGEYLGTDEVFLTKAGGLPAHSVAIAVNTDPILTHLAKVKLTHPL